jgi:hypothetical protein
MKSKPTVYHENETFVLEWQTALSSWTPYLRHICFITSMSATIEVKAGKAVPLQAWTGPEGSRRLRLPEFKTIGT